MATVHFAYSWSASQLPKVENFGKLAKLGDALKYRKLHFNRTACLGYTGCLFEAVATNKRSRQ